MKETIHYLLMADHFMFQKKLFNNLKDTDLTLGQPKVLDYLRNHEGVVQKEIAIACHIEQASLTSVLNGMEKKGLITRETQDGNRRSLYVFLTTKGREEAKRVIDEFDGIEESAMAGFSQAEKEKLNEYLSRIYSNMSLEL